MKIVQDKLFMTQEEYDKFCFEYNNAYSRIAFSSNSTNSYIPLENSDLVKSIISQLKKIHYNYLNVKIVAYAHVKFWKNIKEVKPFLYYHLCDSISYQIKNIEINCEE